MIAKGQIVEIPSTSSIYEDGALDFSSKKEELTSKLEKRNYDLFDGFLVGEHSGLENFKLGQRKGINVGGKKEPLYVIGMNEADNQLFVGAGDQHPGLWTRIFSFSKGRINFQDLKFRDEEFEQGIEVSIHSSVMDIDVISTLYLFDDILFLEFDAPVSITIQDHPMEIYFDRHSSTTIKIN